MKPHPQLGQSRINRKHTCLWDSQTEGENHCVHTDPGTPYYCRERVCLHSFYVFPPNNPLFPSFLFQRPKMRIHPMLWHLKVELNIVRLVKTTKLEKKVKRKEGRLFRIVDSHALICSGLTSKQDNLKTSRIHHSNRKTLEINTSCFPWLWRLDCKFLFNLRHAFLQLHIFTAGIRFVSNQQKHHFRGMRVGSEVVSWSFNLKWDAILFYPSQF